jgi:preprotein translocase subunit SecE
VARDRKRAKQRQSRRSPQGGSLTPASTQPIRSDLSDTLGHTSGEVDEFDAALVRGAGGAPASPEQVNGLAAEELALEAEGTGDGTEAAPPAHRSRRPTGNRAVAFLRASWAELQRVQWPDRRQVSQATAVVLGFVAIAGAYLGLADVVAKKIVEAIL